MTAATLVVDLLTGDVVEFVDRRNAWADADSRRLSVLRPDLPGPYQGGPRFMTYPSDCNVLALVNERRVKWGHPPLDALNRKAAPNGR